MVVAADLCLDLYTIKQDLHGLRRRHITTQQRQSVTMLLEKGSNVKVCDDLEKNIRAVTADC